MKQSIANVNLSRCVNPLKKPTTVDPVCMVLTWIKGIMCLSGLFILQRPLEREQLHNSLPLRAQTWPLFFSLAECFILLSPPWVSSYVVPNRTIKELFGAISCRTVTFVKQDALSCKGILNFGYIAGQAFHQSCVTALIVSACETSKAGSLNIPQKHCIYCFKYPTSNFGMKDIWINSYSDLINGAVSEFWALALAIDLNAHRHERQKSGKRNIKDYVSRQTHGLFSAF